jgi:hypothetical protein
LSIAPLQLELKNATFNDKVTGEKLFFIRDAKLGLTVQDLYAWQLSRDISIDTTEVDGAEVWVRFDENGNSNFDNLKFIEDQTGSRVNFTYSSLKFSLKNGLVHFGDASRKINADAKNILLTLEPRTTRFPMSKSVTNSISLRPIRLSFTTKAPLTRLIFALMESLIN